MPVSMTFTATGEQIGVDLADDMEDAAEALAAFAYRIDEDDYVALGDHLGSIGWNTPQPGAATSPKKLALIELAEFILKTLKPE